MNVHLSYQQLSLGKEKCLKKKKKIMGVTIGK